MSTPPPNHTEPTPAQQHRFDSLAKVAARAEVVALDLFARRSDLARENKTQSDFVTEADRAVEACIRAAIKEYHPQDIVVGEELGGQSTHAYWLIDPIDGTSNFLSGLPLWSISIAYIEDNHPTLGVVSMPMLGRRLEGGKGFDLIETGDTCLTSDNASLVFGIGQNEHWSSDRRDLIEHCIRPQGLTGISLGSCATSLALVASGQLAGYAEGHVGFWDIAAGVALCEAARVPVSFSANDQTSASFVAAGPSAIQKKIFAITRCDMTRSDQD